MRLIDADELNMRFCENPEYSATMFKKIRRVVESTPTIEAEPVKHGRWVSLTECANAGVYCSMCNKKVYKEDYAWSNKRIKMRSNYCPNCGAKMKGADNG